MNHGWSSRASNPSMKPAAFSPIQSVVYGARSVRVLASPRCLTMNRESV